MLTTTVTFEGNIAADVELTYTPTGKQVVKFPVLVNQRKQDPQTGEWTDGEPTRHSCVAFGTSANTSPTAWARATGSWPSVAL